MRNLNLSEWALRHRSLVLYLIIACMVGGVFSYFKLGRAEDPDFTFRVMVVRAFWPGATAREVEQQVTERIEKAVQEVQTVDILRSYAKPGESLVTIILKENSKASEVPDAWYQVRKKISDIRYTLPEGVQGPFFNDEFGDVSSIIFAMTGDGYTLADLRDRADKMAQQLRRLPDVKKVDLLGVQDEKIYVEVSHDKLAAQGIDPRLIAQILQQQNAMTPAGYFDTGSDRVYLRTTGDFETVDHVREIGIRVGARQFRLGDIAKIWRGYAEPANPRFRWNGKDAIGLAVVMARGGNVLDLGNNVRDSVKQLSADLPVGVELNVVADQSEVVNKAVGEFVSSLGEAVLIVLGVSFLSLGLRTGTVVALSIPLVLAITFLAMEMFGIDLQRISLGALIIALGLLVDDAIIAVEMMVVKMEQGWDRFRAACAAYKSTAFPMLTGTLVTAAGFMPVGFARSMSGEYTFSIFAVVVIALLVSWIVAVLFTPYLGYKLLSAEKLREKFAAHGHDVYDTAFYRRFRAIVSWCVSRRWTVIAVTAAAFALSIVAFGGGVQKQFFPSSNRPELLIDVWLPAGTSLKSTEAQTHRLEQLLRDDAVAKDHIEQFSAYVGSGAPRFYLSFDQQLQNDNFAQFVVVTKGLADREVVRDRLLAVLPEQFPRARARVLRLENGPPVGFPLQFRVRGEDPAKLREIAARVADVMRSNPHTANVQFDWNEMTKMVKLDVDQDKARALGVSSQDLSSQLQTLLSGFPITQFRENDKLIDIVGRADQSERAELSMLRDVNIHTQSGRFVPLSQIANLSYELEDGLIWRWNRLPAITVRADIRGEVQPATLVGEIDPRLDAIRATLPPGYNIEVGGTVESSAKAEKSIQAVFPVMIVIILTLLMLQLQSMSRMALVVLTAPLGMIGVTFALLVFNQPFGFVAQLGVIALGGMIMRNSVILVDQIDQDIAEGKTPWEAVIDSTVRRFRPIMLTALAAILAMIPLSRSIFWGPMAAAIMGGLLVATVLTLIFLPALYAAWFRITPATPARQKAGDGPDV